MRIVYEAPGRALALPASFQLASGALGVALAFAALAVLAAASIAYPFVTPHPVSGWPMLAFALLGLLVNAASVLSARPERLSARHPLAVRASSAGYAMLAGAGVAGLLRPEGWICVAAVIATMPVLAAEQLLGGRSKRGGMMEGGMMGGGMMGGSRPNERWREPERR